MSEGQFTKRRLRTYALEPLLEGTPQVRSVAATDQTARQVQTPGDGRPQLFLEVGPNRARTRPLQALQEGFCPLPAQFALLSQQKAAAAQDHGNPYFFWRASAYLWCANIDGIK